MKTILLVIVGGTLWGLLLLAAVAGAIQVSPVFDHIFFHTVFGGIVFLGILVLLVIQSVGFFLPTQKVD